MKKSKNIVTKDGRTRNFACVVYADSAPENWQAILAEQFIPCFISPYHDKDFNPDGEPKKPHWHVMLMFDGVKTKEQAKQVFEKINGVGLEIIQSVRGYARYLCHLDNPEKAQYNTEDVKMYNGADYLGQIGLATDKYKAISEMMLFCCRNQLTSYRRLLDYCSHERYDWFRVLCDNGSYVILEYIKSLAWEQDKSNSTVEMPIDWWTGKELDLKT